MSLGNFISASMFWLELSFFSFHGSNHLAVKRNANLGLCQFLGIGIVGIDSFRIFPKVSWESIPILGIVILCIQ